MSSLEDIRKAQHWIPATFKLSFIWLHKVPFLIKIPKILSGQHKFADPSSLFKSDFKLVFSRRNERENPRNQRRWRVSFKQLFIKFYFMAKCWSCQVKESWHCRRCIIMWGVLVLWNRRLKYIWVHLASKNTWIYYQIIEGKKKQSQLGIYL